MNSVASHHGIDVVKKERRKRRRRRLLLLGRKKFRRISLPLKEEEKGASRRTAGYRLSVFSCLWTSTTIGLDEEEEEPRPPPEEAEEEEEEDSSRSHF